MNNYIILPVLWTCIVLCIAILINKYCTNKVFKSQNFKTLSNIIIYGASGDSIIIVWLIYFLINK
jgi:hypothetical protein